MDDDGDDRIVLVASPSQIPPFCGIDHPKTALRDALHADEAFIVAVDPDPFDGPDPARPDAPAAVFADAIAIAGWKFAIDIGAGSQDGAFRNVLLVKFCRGALIDLVADIASWTAPDIYSIAAGGTTLPALSAWLQAYLREAIDRSATDPIYDGIASIAADPQWRGVIALNVSLTPADTLPPPLSHLAPRIDPAGFVGHHVGASVATLAPPGSDSGSSPTFALVDQRPASSVLRSPDDSPTAIRILALFENAALKEFSIDPPVP